MAGKGRGNTQKVTKERVIAHPRSYLVYPDLAQNFKNPLLNVVVKEHTVDRGRGGGKVQVCPGDVLVDRLHELAEMEGIVTVMEGVEICE